MLLYITKTSSDSISISLSGDPWEATSGSQGSLLPIKRQSLYLSLPLCGWVGSYRSWKTWELMELKNFIFKAWKVMEFNNFQSLKIMEFIKVLFGRLVTTGDKARIM